MSRLSRESGETLLESVISVLVIAIGIVGLLTSLASGVNLSAAHSDQSRADLALRTGLEKWDASAYKVGTSQAQIALLLAGLPLAPGHSLVVGTPRCWSGAPPDLSSSASFPECTALNDRGLQLLTLSVTSSTGRVLQTMDVVKRCRPDECPPTSFS